MLRSVTGRRYRPATTCALRYRGEGVIRRFNPGSLVRCRRNRNGDYRLSIRQGRGIWMPPDRKRATRVEKFGGVLDRAYLYPIHAWS